ncbi:hypothetical protein RSOLAG1IB_08961 [Rhizoctonia solani AG-1 IB]|uniref:Uncharacterized protein n=1 Tax=Thanatephorus cucumeris (strain AG1-IB / isolate 7/3/14) TaxID=1108050 RepID=A0A0B7FML8_THACB|nr:hypothetical protein RSOLAG1IB_08961 [Rhizoctonia solani AG-1 IB]
MIDSSPMANTQQPSSCGIPTVELPVLPVPDESDKFGREGWLLAEPFTPRPITRAPGMLSRISIPSFLHRVIRIFC